MSVSSISPEVLQSPETVLTPEAAEEVDQKLAALSEIIDKEVDRKAKYKIEVVFHWKKTNRGNSAGIVCLFRSDSGLSGEADEIIYPCPSQSQGGPPCSGIIAPEGVSSLFGFAVCPSCHKKWNRAELQELTFYCLPPEKWAEVLAKEFFRLSCDADIIIKPSGKELRSSSLHEIENRRHGESLFAARSTRKTICYRMVDLVRDVNAGADVQQRIRAFLTA